MRLFVAVELKPHVCDRIAAAIAAFPVRNPPWRWSRRPNWHLTLKFLGDTPRTNLPAITAALEEAASKHRPFEIALGSLGGFPDLNRPRVLFYRVEVGAAPLGALAGDVDELLETRAGVERDRKPFRGHATVARVKVSIDADLASELRGSPPLSHASQPVGHIALIHSTLSPQGARYERLKQFALPQAP